MSKTTGWVLGFVLGVAACAAPAGPALPAGIELACDVGGQIRFPRELLEGPRFGREEFVVTTAPGRVLDSFFSGGPGEAEGDAYARAVGFSIVSDTLILGYERDVPASFFILEDGRVEQWGGCRPILVAGDLVAARWRLARPVDPAATVLALQIDADACSTDDGNDVLTEVVSVDVTEHTDTVDVVVWVRDRPIRGSCPGGGVVVDATATLSRSLDGRSLLDAGTVPPSPVPTE